MGRRAAIAALALIAAGCGRGASDPATSRLAVGSEVMIWTEKPGEEAEVAFEKTLFLDKPSKMGYAAGWRARVLDDSAGDSGPDRMVRIAIGLANDGTTKRRNLRPVVAAK